MKPKTRKSDTLNQKCADLRGVRDTPENMPDIVATVEALAAPVCESEAMELVHVVYQRERGGKILRVYIDKEGGVTLEDCVLISRQLSDLLDVNLESAGAYSLEVSSPGSDRPLSKLRDFERFKECQAKIRVKKPLEEKKNFTGVLKGIVGETIRIQVREKIVNIPFENISRARLVNYNGDIPC